MTIEQPRRTAKTPARKNRSIRQLVVVIVVALALLASACGPASNSTPDVAAPTQSPTVSFAPESVETADLAGAVGAGAAATAPSAQAQPETTSQPLPASQESDDAVATVPQATTAVQTPADFADIDDDRWLPPGVSGDDEIEAAVQQALAAPNFVEVVERDQLGAVGVAQVAITPEVRIDARQFLDATALPDQAEFAALFSPNTQSLFVQPPTYAEPIIVLDDQILVDRGLHYELVPGVCQVASNRQSLGDLCFDIHEEEEIPTEVTAHLTEVRRRLGSVSPATVIAGGVTAGQALQLSDTALLDLSLNAGPRSIRRLSGVALVADVEGVQPGLSTSSDTANGGRFGGLFEAPGGVFVDPGTAQPLIDFDTEYFLTGLTVGRSYGDTWSYDKDAWWHPRIFVSFSYSLDAGFGVRAPFSVDVDYVSGELSDATLAVSVDPVSLDVAAEHVGLPSDLFFDGKEFVLELDFDCTLTASVAGVGGSTGCDDFFSVDTNFSQDLDPVIGNETRNIENWWLWDDGKSPIRGEILGGAIFAEINVGIGADVVNGRFGTQIDGLPNTDLSGVTEGELTWFNSRGVRTVQVERGSRFGGSGLSLSDPHYAFDIAVRPKVKFNAGIDVKVYDKSWSFVWPLDFLGISAGFELDHHEGTVEQHDFVVTPEIIVQVPFEVPDQVLTLER